LNEGIDQRDGAGGGGTHLAIIGCATGCAHFKLIGLMPNNCELPMQSPPSAQSLKKLNGKRPLAN